MTQILSIKTLKSVKFPIFILVIMAFCLVSIFPVYGKTAEEIEKELEDKQSELENLEAGLQEAEEMASYYEAQKNSAGSEIERVGFELKQLEAEMNVNQAELEKYNQELKIRELELEQNEKIMNVKMVDLYIYNRQSIVDVMLENGEVEGFWKDYKYRETILDNDLAGVESVALEVESLKEERAEIERSIALLDEENQKLAGRIAELESQQSYFASMAAYSVGKQEGIRAEMGAVEQQIEGLTEEHRRIIEEENTLIGDANGGTKPLEPGDFYFYGRGRSLYQGHGLGFSQYGAFGGAQHGMPADSIATFYYQGSYIGHVSGTIEVIGYGTMNIEDYVAGLGEIPDKACGSQAQVNSRPDKYVLDNPNSIWDCWPEESVKAQVIVARSYGVAYGGPICTSAACQVYKGGQGKRWAADETSGKVLQVGGTTIKAYYSSDNNNGWGTGTHRNPAWCWDFHGNCGGGFSWLQSVNDSSFAAKGPYTDWMWRTNSYSLSEIQSMFEWYANKGYYNSGNVRQLLNTVGTLADFQISRDASGRAARIKVIGSTGSVDVNGEIFKEIWNLWVGNVQPSGEVDPVFSLTYYFRKV